MRSAWMRAGTHDASALDRALRNAMQRNDCSGWRAASTQSSVRDLSDGGSICDELAHSACTWLVKTHTECAACKHLSVWTIVDPSWPASSTHLSRWQSRSAFFAHPSGTHSAVPREKLTRCSREHTWDQDDDAPPLWALVRSALRRNYYLCHSVYLYVRLSAGLHQKIAGGFGWNFQGRLNLARLRDDYNSVVIRICIWIQARIGRSFILVR